MRLVTFTHNGAPRAGSVRDGHVIDLNAADPSIPADMLSLLQGGEAMLDKARHATETGSVTASLTDVTLHSPVLAPPKILAVGINYMSHIDEIPAEIKQRMNLSVPQHPVIFNKQTPSASGPYDPVMLPKESPELDYEAELGVVIGKTCRRVSKADALEVVAGYVICNDFTIREWQRMAPTMTMGKSWDSHCPMGPALVTKDEVPDPHNLHVTLSVDGEVKQDFNTSEMIFNISALIEFLSTAFTLTPGDVIVSGTAAGVAVFRPGKPFLQEGQRVRVEIDKLGFIENNVQKDEGLSFIR